MFICPNEKGVSALITNGLHCMRCTRNIIFKLDPVVSFSTYFRDSYCSKGSVVFRLSNGIIIKGAKSDAVVVVGVDLGILILCYLDLEWLDRWSDKWAKRRRNRGSAAGIFETFISSNSPQRGSGFHTIYCSVEIRDFFPQKVKRPGREVDH